MRISVMILVGSTFFAMPAMAQTPTPQPTTALPPVMATMPMTAPAPTQDISATTTPLSAPRETQPPGMATQPMPPQQPVASAAPVSPSDTMDTMARGARPPEAMPPVPAGATATPPGVMPPRPVPANGDITVIEAPNAAEKPKDEKIEVGYDPKVRRDPDGHPLDKDGKRVKKQEGPNRAGNPSQPGSVTPGMPGRF
jgi:hypothetical protein